MTPTATRSWALMPGANDYVTKPFKFPVLLARIRAQLRTHEQSEDAIFQLGPYTFKPAQKMLVDEKEKKIRLTEKETNILKYLYRAQPGRGGARCAAARGLGLQRRASPPTRWKPTSTACARRSSPIRRTPGFWSPKAVATDWLPNGLIVARIGPIESMQAYCPAMQIPLPRRGNGTAPPCWTWPGIARPFFHARLIQIRVAVRRVGVMARHPPCWTWPGFCPAFFCHVGRQPAGSA